MNAEQLRHILGAAAAVTGERIFVVIGSQAILGSHPDAPRSLRKSVEGDTYPKDHPDKAIEVDGAIGELYPFTTNLVTMPMVSTSSTAHFQAQHPPPPSVSSAGFSPSAHGSQVNRPLPIQNLKFIIQNPRPRHPLFHSKSIIQNPTSIPLPPSLHFNVQCSKLRVRCSTFSPPSSIQNPKSKIHHPKSTAPPIASTPLSPLVIHRHCVKLPACIKSRTFLQNGWNGIPSALRSAGASQDAFGPPFSH